MARSVALPFAGDREQNRHAPARQQHPGATHRRSNPRDPHLQLTAGAPIPFHHPDLTLRFEEPVIPGPR